MSAIAKTDFLASVAKRDRDGFSVLTELRGRSPAVLIVLSGQQDRGGLVRAVNVGALQLVFANGEHTSPETLARDEPSARQSDEKRPGNRGAPGAPSLSPFPERHSST